MVSSIFSWDTTVHSIEEGYILLWLTVLYENSIVLLGSATKRGGGGNLKPQTLNPLGEKLPTTWVGSRAQGLVVLVSRL